MALKYTQKLDRISNNKLTLGLSNPVDLTSSSQGLAISNNILLADKDLSSVANIFATGNVSASGALSAPGVDIGETGSQKDYLVTKNYVDTTFKNYLISDIFKASSTYFAGDDRISVATDGTKVNIGFSDYDASYWSDNISAVKTFEYGTGSSVSTSASSYVVSGLEIDKNGVVSGVKYSKVQIDSSQISGTTKSSWKLNGTYDIGTTGTSDNEIVTNLAFAAGSGLNITYSPTSQPTTTGQTVTATFSPIVDGSTIVLADNKLAQKDVLSGKTDDFSSATVWGTQSLFTAKLDKWGHVVDYTKKTANDLVADMSEATLKTKLFGTNALTVAEGGTGVKTLAANKLLQGNGTDGIKSEISLAETIDLTGTGVNNTSVPTTQAVYKFVQDGFNSNDAMQFIGTIASDSTITSGRSEVNGKRIDALTDYSAGWTFKAAGAISELKINSVIVGSLEPGDMLIAIKDYASVLSADDWSIVQNNIEGSVTTTGGTSGELALFNGSSTITDSGITLTTANGKADLTGLGVITATKFVGNFEGTISGTADSATKLETARNIWGQSFDGTADISGKLTGVGGISPSENGTINIGSNSLKWANVYANSFVGDLTGNAASATKVNKSLTIKGTESDTGVLFDGSSAQTIVLNSYGYLKSLTSSIFNIPATSSNTTSIGFLSSKTAGAFYTGDTAPSSSNKLNYDGYLYATHLYSEGTLVAIKPTTTAGTTEKSIAIVDSSSNYLKSAYTISNENSNWDSDGATYIPTKFAVGSQISAALASGTKVLALAIPSATGSSTSTISLTSGTLIKSISVKIGSLYASGATVSVKAGTVELMTADESLLSSGVGDVFTVSPFITLSSDSTISATVANSTGTSASATAYIEYVK